MCHSGIPSRASRSMRAASSRATRSASSACACCSASLRSSASCCERIASRRYCSTLAIFCQCSYSLCALASSAALAFLDASISAGVLPLSFNFCAFSKTFFFSSAIESAITLAVAVSPSLYSTRASQASSGVSACSKIGSPFSSRGIRCKGVGSAVETASGSFSTTGAAFSTGLGTVSVFSGTMPLSAGVLTESSGCTGASG